MNVKECERQYRRGIRCRKRFKCNFYSATIFCLLYLPVGLSERESFIWGWNHADRNETNRS